MSDVVKRPDDYAMPSWDEYEKVIADRDRLAAELAAEKARWGELREWVQREIRCAARDGEPMWSAARKAVIDHMDTLAPVDCVRVVVKDSKALAIRPITEDEWDLREEFGIE